MEDQIVIYTKPGCPYCQAAKADFQRQGLAYREIDVSTTPGAREEAYRLAGQHLVPVIVRGKEVTVGYGGA